MTQEQYDELIAQAKSLKIPGDGRRWAWNRAATLGLHPEQSGILEPPMDEKQRRQAASDWHDDLTISRDWLSRRA